MTVKDKIRNKLRWQSNRTYKGMTEGWQETGLVDVPEENENNGASAENKASEDSSSVDVKSSDSFERGQPLLGLSERMDAMPTTEELELKKAEDIAAAQEARKEIVSDMTYREAEEQGLSKSMPLGDVADITDSSSDTENRMKMGDEALASLGISTNSEVAADAIDAHKLSEQDQRARDEIAAELGFDEISIFESSDSPAEEPASDTAEEPANDEPASDTAEEPVASDVSEDEMPDDDDLAEEIEIPELDLDNLEPAADEPANDEPASDTAEEPANDEPASDTAEEIEIPELDLDDLEPAAEEPASDTAEEIEIPELNLDNLEPAAEEPANDEPASDTAEEIEIPELDLDNLEPAAEEPAAEEPSGDTAEEPANEKPAAEESADNGTATDEPAAEEPSGDTAEEPAEVEPPAPVIKDGDELTDDVAFIDNSEAEETENKSEEKDVEEPADDGKKKKSKRFGKDKGKGLEGKTSKRKAEKETKKEKAGLGGMIFGLFGNRQKAAKKGKGSQEPEIDQEAVNKFFGELSEAGAFDNPSDEAATDEAAETAQVTEIEPEPDILEDVTEVYLEGIDTDNVTIEEAEALAREQVRAQKEAEALANGKGEDDGEEKPPAPAPVEIEIDPASIKIPFYIKKEDKKEKYVKNQIKKKKAKIKKKAAAIKNKEKKAKDKVKKAEEKVKKAEEKKVQKAEWKASKPERKAAKKAEKQQKKKEKKAANAEKKAANKEKKAAAKLKKQQQKKEKKAAKKAKRQAWWKAKSQASKIIFVMWIVVIIMVVVIAGGTFAPMLLDKASNLPGEMAARNEEKAFEKLMTKTDSADAELLACIDSVVEQMPMEHDVFAKFGLESSLKATQGSAIFVAPSGSDSGAGTEASPYHTLKHAMEMVADGGVIYLEPATYHEPLEITQQGSKHKYFTISTKLGSEKKAVIDGRLVAENEPLITIKDTKYIMICNLELKNAGSGILVENSSAVILAGLNIHDMKKQDDKAYGIKITNTTDQTKRSYLIYYNYIDTIYNGVGVHASGNMEYVNMLGNRISRVDGNGVEYIGGNMMCSNAATDCPRDCEIKSNSFMACKTARQIGYGVYLDNVREIDMQDNIAYRCDRGFVITSSDNNLGHYTDDINMVNNLAACNELSAFYIGTSTVSSGFVDNITLDNNSCLNSYSSDEGCDLFIRNAGTVHARKNLFCNNKADGMPCRVMISTNGKQKLTLRDNVYMSKADAEDCRFMYRDEEIEGFENWVNACGDSGAGYYEGEASALCNDPLNGDFSCTNDTKTYGCSILHRGSKSE